MIKTKEGSFVEIALPQILVESCLRQQGLVLIVGNRNSCLEKTLEALQHKWKELPNNKSVFVTRESKLANEVLSSLIKSGFHMSSYNNRLDSNEHSTLREASVLVFENIQSENELAAAINFYEDGRLVLLHVSAPSIVSALHRLFGLALQTQNPHLLWRLIDGFTLMFSQTKISNLQSEFVFANEVVLTSPEVKKCLWKGELNDFEELMKNAGEHSGIVTMNQSLLQLLIRRRIEIKTAFEVSRDPVDLDQLLKKVGV